MLLLLLLLSSSLPSLLVGYGSCWCYELKQCLECRDFPAFIVKINRKGGARGRAVVVLLVLFVPEFGSTNDIDSGFPGETVEFSHHVPTALNVIGIAIVVVVVVVVVGDGNAEQFGSTGLTIVAHDGVENRPKVPHIGYEFVAALEGQRGIGKGTIGIVAGKVNVSCPEVIPFGVITTDPFQELGH